MGILVLLAVSTLVFLVVRNNSSTTARMSPEEAKTEVLRLSNSAKVFVFSKAYCPFCTKVKKLLKSLGIEFSAIELDEVANGSTLQAALIQLTGQRTVPNTFVSGKTIGGCDDVHALNASGKLMQIVNA